MTVPQYFGVEIEGAEFVARLSPEAFEHLWREMLHDKPARYHRTTDIFGSRVVIRIKKITHIFEASEESHRAELELKLGYRNITREILGWEEQ